MPSKQVLRYKRKSRGAAKQRERIVQRRLASYTTSEYPDVVFFNDWASGAYLTDVQNRARLSLACKHGWVDVFYAEASRGYHGLFLELKKEDVVIYNKNGLLRADSQIRKEAAFLEKMRSKGYCAMFAVGLEDAKKKLDWYFKNSRAENTELF